MKNEKKESNDKLRRRPRLVGDTRRTSLAMLVVNVVN